MNTERHYNLTSLALYTNNLNSVLENDCYVIAYVDSINEIDNIFTIHGYACVLTSKINKQRWFNEGEKVYYDGKIGTIVYIYSNNFACVSFDNEPLQGGIMTDNNLAMPLDELWKVKNDN
jgi:hypothetical protein